MCDEALVRMKSVAESRSNGSSRGAIGRVSALQIVPSRLEGGLGSWYMARVVLSSANM